MERLRQTPSQTVGPFFAYSLTAHQYGYPYDSLMNHALVGPITPDQYAGAERICLTGRVMDGHGSPIPDAIVELWQADPMGQYRTAPFSPKDDSGTEFAGFGRLGTGTQPGAVFQFDTLKPGCVQSGSIGDGSARPRSAPHINVLLFMRGSLRSLYTRLYFSDEEAANAQDALLNAVPEDRRHTLIAHRREANGQVVYTFDIWMQGEQETVFFDV